MSRQVLQRILCLEEIKPCKVAWEEHSWNLLEAGSHSQGWVKWRLDQILVRSSNIAMEYSR